MSDAEVLALLKHKDACDRLRLCNNVTEFQEALRSYAQTISNTAAVLENAQTAPQTPDTPAAPTVNSDDPILYFIDTIAGRSSTLTSSIVMDKLSEKPEWLTAYNEALAKGSYQAQMYLIGNLDLIGELFAYI